MVIVGRLQESLESRVSFIHGHVVFATTNKTIMAVCVSSLVKRYGGASSRHQNTALYRDVSHPGSFYLKVTLKGYGNFLLPSKKLVGIFFKQKSGAGT